MNVSNSTTIGARSSISLLLKHYRMLVFACVLYSVCQTFNGTTLL